MPTIAEVFSGKMHPKLQVELVMGDFMRKRFLVEELCLEDGRISDKKGTFSVIIERIKNIRIIGEQ